jgi:hypothetical protein
MFEGVWASRLEGALEVQAADLEVALPISTVLDQYIHIWVIDALR